MPLIIRSEFAVVSELGDKLGVSDVSLLAAEIHLSEALDLEWVDDSDTEVSSDQILSKSVAVVAGGFHDAIGILGEQLDNVVEASRIIGEASRLAVDEGVERPFGDVDTDVGCHRCCSIMGRAEAGLPSITSLILVTSSVRLAAQDRSLVNCTGIKKSRNGRLHS